MIKKSLCALYALSLVCVYAHEMSVELNVSAQTVHKVSDVTHDYDVTAPDEIVESAIEEAIICLQQLQGRLVEAVVYKWAVGLQDYLYTLLNNHHHLSTDQEMPLFDPTKTLCL